MLGDNAFKHTAEQEAELQRRMAAQRPSNRVAAWLAVLLGGGLSLLFFSSGSDEGLVLGIFFAAVTLACIYFSAATPRTPRDRSR